MPLSSDVSRSLNFLRQKYNVSERDLVSLAKKLKVREDPSESWEEIVHRFKRNRLGRFTRLGRTKGGHPK